jgi:hypothetical protein
MLSRILVVQSVTPLCKGDRYVPSDDQATASQRHDRQATRASSHPGSLWLCQQRQPRRGQNRPILLVQHDLLSIQPGNRHRRTLPRYHLCADHRLGKGVRPPRRRPTK